MFHIMQNSVTEIHCSYLLYTVATLSEINGRKPSTNAPPPIETSLCTSLALYQYINCSTLPSYIAYTHTVCVLFVIKT